MMIEPRISALIASHILEASHNKTGAPEGSDGVGLFEVMNDPYEWKSAVKVALVFFIASLALAPALTPDQKKLAAEINNKTLKAAAAVKSSVR